MEKLTTLSHVFGNLLGLFAKVFAIVLMIALIGCTSSSTDDSDDNTPPQEQPSNPDNDNDNEDNGSDDNGNDDSSNENEDYTDENIGQHVQEINSVIEPLFKECNNIEEISSYIEDIKVIEGVSEVWTTNNALYVNTKSGAKLAWLFTPDDNPEQTEYEEYTSEVINTTQTRSSEQDHEYIVGSDKMEFCIINQQANDESRNWLNTYYNELGNSFPSDAFNVTYINGHEVNINFLKSEFLQYDIIFFITHGGYDGKKHWIMSGTEVDTTNELLVESFYKTVKGDDVSIHSVKETRDKETTIVSYVTFSEDFIKNSIKGNFDNSIIFCTACQSLKDNNKIANAFKARGAKAYLGYNETNSVGKLAGTRFYNTLLRGYTIDQAYNNMSKNDRVDPNYSAQLISAIPNAENICIVHPKVKTIEKTEVEGTSATLEGVVEEWNGNKLLEGVVGFCWSKDNNDPKYNDSDKFAVKNIKASDEKEIKLSHTIKDLEPATQYYYRAYLQINGEYQYGDVMSFTTEEEPDDAYMRAYLIKLYNDTNGDNWKRNDNWCSNKPLDEWYGVNKSNNNNLYRIYLSNNNLSGTIDLQGCSALELLTCYNNNLESINVSNCNHLESLLCYKNQLTIINALGCQSLIKIDSDNNKLANINISNSPNLKELYCENNQLTNLDVSGCTELSKLSCSSNKLTNLNINGCISIIDLDCSSNKLSSINVSSCQILEELYCENNQLTNLDVSGCTSIHTINCNENNLTNLNTNGCIALKKLKCWRNSLTYLNVSDCKEISYIECGENRITAEITLQLYKCAFYYDARYEYTAQWIGYTWTDNGYGWYYPGEPSERGHKPPEDWYD